MRLKFYREDKDKWFFHKPWIQFILGKPWMAMVLGADTLLDKLSDGKDVVELEVSTSNFIGAEILFRTEKHEGILGGASYKMMFRNGEVENHDLWLCPVTLFLLLKYPETIYFRVL